MSGSIELAGEDYSNLMRQIASLEAEVEKLTAADHKSHDFCCELAIKIGKEHGEVMAWRELTGCATPEEAREKLAALAPASTERPRDPDAQMDGGVAVK